MNKDSMRDLLDGQAGSFRVLSRKNTETFVETEDDFFKGKAEAYKLAAELSRASSETIYHWRVMMILYRISDLTGEVHCMDLDVTDAQLELYDEFGVLLQDAFPNLTADEREFIKTGITPEEWDEYFGKD
jgi:hypothetical protein